MNKRDVHARGCGRCHTCGARLRLLPGGHMEYCPRCERYRRYERHGMTGNGDSSPCWTPEELEAQRLGYWPEEHHGG
jgi:hypothetical protein